jgi:hypothetical protein
MNNTKKSIRFFNDREVLPFGTTATTNGGSLS